MPPRKLYFNGKHNCQLFRDVDSNGRFFVWCTIDAEVTHEWEDTFLVKWNNGGYERTSIKNNCQTTPRGATAYRELVALNPRGVVCVACCRNLRKNEVFNQHKATNEHRNSVLMFPDPRPVYEQPVETGWQE